MELNIRVLVVIEGSRSLHFGRFKVNDLTFPLNSHEEAARYGYQVYQRIKYETGYRKTELLNATYNGEHDITDLVKEVERQLLK
ncbi:hypothetical protein [Heyndrickxia acidicola]|uniref:Uncharacterized protein n=1 Tax=Heyndrickxia acidicola TaxID=209389 RepID=A0ABU6MCB8_9BACI|nr:hypothetical protein [Heyndrickxia acidicola]MED1202317.1 hypothetical protein [Heyndrickxia acidicola]